MMVAMALGECRAGKDGQQAGEWKGAPHRPPSAIGRTLMTRNMPACM